MLCDEKLAEDWTRPFNKFELGSRSANGHGGFLFAIVAVWADKLSNNKDS